MLPCGLFFLVASAVEALVLTPAWNLSPNMAQDSAGEVTSSETVSSALVEDASFTTAMSSLSIANSSLASNSSLSRDVSIMCVDSSGVGLNYESCVSAVATMERTRTQYTWGPRDTLPIEIVVTDELLVDGTCIIEAILFQAASAKASILDVALGALTLVTECVKKKNPGMGGLAKDFGGDNNLVLLMGKPDAPPTNSIMDGMDVSRTPKVFGRGGGDGVDVELPYILHSADHRCIMTLRTSGPSDTTSWLEVWEAATAATGMCTAQGKKGVFSQIGPNKKLYLEVAAEVAGNDETS